jgi:O-antigen/teichoic acid export membrane protein
MSRLRKAAKATVVTQFFHWSALLLSLATVPLYLAWLGEERYGLLLTGIALSSYLMFSDAGINWASMLLIAQADGRGDREGIAAIFRSSFPLAACSGLLVAAVTGGVVWCLHRGAAGWLPAHPEFPGLLLAVGASVLVNLGLSPFFNLLIGLQETQIAAAYQGFGRLAGAAGAVTIAASGAPLGWIQGGTLAGSLLAGILAAIHCLRGHRWAFRRGPLWEPARLVEQVRTGARSLLVQAGNVLWGTAPVMAISLGAGARFVPFVSIPTTLLNAPLGILTTFSATLQPGYGEAMGRGEIPWIAETVGRLLRHALIAIGLLSCGFLLLANPFIRWWTGGRIDPGWFLLAGVLTLASVNLLLSVFRFALTGINRHRLACVSDIAGGALAMGAAFLLARGTGYEWGLFAVAAVALATSGWILPLELKRSLPGQSFLPPAGFCLRCLVAFGGSFGTAWFAGRFLSGAPLWLDLVLRGGIITITYVGMIRWLLPEEARAVARILLRRRSAEA